MSGRGSLPLRRRISRRSSSILWSYRGSNADELPAIAYLTIENDWHVRFIEVMPIGNAQGWGEGFPAPDERYVSVQEMHDELYALRSST